MNTPPIGVAETFQPVQFNHRFKDMSGRTFGRLTVIECVGTRDNRAMWKCLCSCGRIAVVSGKCLRRDTKSCGCLMRETTIKRSTTHGLSGTREFRIYYLMIQRCENPNNESYPYYGGRGIKICKRWRDSLEAFVSDMGPCPDGLSINRVNNDGDYEPNNCKWATVDEQAKNKSSTRFVTFRGETLCLKDMARRYGIDYHALIHRIESGWPIEKALTTPSRAKTRL